MAIEGSITPRISVDGDTPAEACRRAQQYLQDVKIDLDTALKMTGDAKTRTLISTVYDQVRGLADLLYLVDGVPTEDEQWD